MARNVRSRVTLFNHRITQLQQAQIRALEKTAEALHTEVVQAQIMPRDAGTLQNKKTFVDKSDSRHGKVYIVSEGPYARRLYFHPEYDFQKYENPFAQGKWFTPWLPGGISEDFTQNTYTRLLRREMRD